FRRWDPTASHERLGWVREVAIRSPSVKHWQRGCAPRQRPWERIASLSLPRAQESLLSFVRSWLALKLWTIRPAKSSPPAMIGCDKQRRAPLNWRMNWKACARGVLLWRNALLSSWKGLFLPARHNSSVSSFPPICTLWNGPFLFFQNSMLNSSETLTCSARL